MSKTPEQIEAEALALYDELGDGDEEMQEMQVKLLRLEKQKKAAERKRKMEEAIASAEKELAELKEEEVAEENEEELEKKRYASQHRSTTKANKSLRTKPAPKQPPKQQAQSKKNGHMAKSWNDCRFQGYTKDDTEMSYSANGNAYSKFTLKVSQGKGKMPIFLKVTTFGDLAEEVNDAIIDGTHVEVLGSLTQNKGNNGVYYTEMIADSVTIIEERD